MLSSETSAADFLERLKALLERGPEGQDTALRSLVEDLAIYRKAPENETMEKALETLATAVGKQKAWQIPFRDAGVLPLALVSLDSDDTTSQLRKQYLRVIGNCVADNDTNREVVTVELQKLLAWLGTKELTTIVLIVLFNLCNDFDPAKAAAAALRLDTTIAERLFLDKIPEAALDYAVELITWTTGKLTVEQLLDVRSLKAFADLLKVALQYDEEHHHEYVAILVHYLQDPEFQHKVAAPELLDDLVVLMLDFEARLTPAEIEAVFQELAITKTDDKPPSDDTNVLLLSQLINSISALSSTDAFAQNFNIRTPVIERIRATFRNPTYRSPSTVCTCVMLGNLAMSDEVCVDMIRIMGLQNPLLEMLAFERHSALLYAAAGFMRHLTFPEANRTDLGNANLVEACHTVLAVSRDPAVLGEIAAILCKLVTNNPDNIERVVMQRIGERRSEPQPGELPLPSVSDGPSALKVLVNQCFAPATPLPSMAMKNLSIEAGRTIVAILRYLGRPNAERDVDAIRQRMFEVPYIARPVARLLRQRFYADARSEGLLGLGLMAQSPKGAGLVIAGIKEDAGLLDAIKEFAEGKDGGADQQGAATGRDYQNAMVLLQALQNNGGNEMDGPLKDYIVSLQGLLCKLMV